MKLTFQQKIKKVTLKNLKESLDNGILIRSFDQRDNNQVSLFDTRTKEITYYNLKILREDIKNFDKKYPIISVVFVYDPTKESGLFVENNDYKFNTYVLPSWRLNFLEDILELPKIYDDFFKYFTNNDSDSFDYILNWMAYSLHAKNYLPFLCCVGKKGVGKGLFGNILRELHGHTNSTITSQSLFKSNFNSQIKDKTLVHLDEIKIKNDKDMNILKLLINDTIEIEEKYKTPKNINNYAFIYISSNNMDIFKITKDERRFSIPIITDTPLQFSDLIKNISLSSFYNDCLSFNNIQKLGSYLLARFSLINKKINMHAPFHSQNTKNIIASSLSDWELEVVGYVQKNTKVYLENLQEYLAYNNLVTKAPGRKKIQKIVDVIPELEFKLDTTNNKRYLLWRTNDNLLKS